MGATFESEVRGDEKITFSAVWFYTKIAKKHILCTCVRKI